MENNSEHGHGRQHGYPEVYVDKESGWDMFNPEVAWFIHDFFKYDLSPYEKLLFYSYYINGLTLEEIGNSAGCTLQNIALGMKKIERKIHNRWKTKKYWRLEDDDKSKTK